MPFPKLKSKRKKKEDKIEVQERDEYMQAEKGGSMNRKRKR